MTPTPPEPGLVPDLSLGLPGPAEPLPADDADQDEPTAVNDPDEDVDDEATP